MTHRPGRARKAPGAQPSAPDRDLMAPGGRPPVTVVLLDDNRLFREALVDMIQRHPGFRVVTASADVEEALRNIGDDKPDVVLLQWGLSNHDTAVAIARLRSAVVGVKVVITGFMPAQEEVMNYVRAGASGFIMKDASLDEFVTTIRVVAAGDQVLPPALTNALFSQIGRPAVTKDQPPRTAERLSNREREVVDLLAAGLSNKEIAARMNIAVHTVKSHVRNVLGKLSLPTRLEVAAFCHAQARSSPLRGPESAGLESTSPTGG